MACYGDKKPMPRVSTHFTVQEVEHSSTALRLGIDNKPPQHVIERAELVAHHIMEPCREEFAPVSGFIPSSWFRCEELEKVITWDGGFRRWCAARNLPWIKRSDVYKKPKTQESWATYFARKQHPTGGAVDFEIPGVDNDTLFFWIRDNLEFDQLIREFPKPSVPSSGWVHGSWTIDGDGNRKQFFSIPTYDKYL